MTAKRIASTVAACIMMTFLPVAILHAQSTGSCAGAAGCAQTRDFVATVSDFRFSTSGSYRVLTTTIRYENRTTHPLILGYIKSSGVATDDRGNRYLINGDAAVRAMGQIGSSVDPKFVLQPGEASEARFEFAWRPESHVIYGTAYDLDLTIREINPITGSQFKLGSEFALRFTKLTPPFSASAPATAATSTTPAPVTTQATAAQPQLVNATDNSAACAGIAHCYNSGPFTATVTSISVAPSGRNRLMEARIRFRNTSPQPLILGYTAYSSSALDNLNNRFYWGRAGTHDVSVQGIGMVQSQSADPQFALRPGESREATFHTMFFDGANKGVGSSYSYDLSVEQLQILPSQQVQSARQYALHFDGLTPGASAQNISDAVSKLKGLFKKP